MVFTLDDVALYYIYSARRVLLGRCGVKAAGGIRTLAEVKAMLEAGANRMEFGLGGDRARAGSKSGFGTWGAPGPDFRTWETGA